MEHPKCEPYKAVFKIEKEKPNSSSSRVTWNKEHDTQLLLLVQENKGKNWKKIAAEMQKTFNNPELTAKKCRERWCNCTNPELDKTSLNETEELFLLIYHAEYKNKWALISQHLPNRNSSKLKNNFSSLIRKICRKISLDDKEVLTSMFSYIQTLYASVLIYDLTSLKEIPEEAVAIAPIHIYEHVKGKRLTPEQCLQYINRNTIIFLGRYKSRTKLQKLADLKKIDEIKSFLNKVINAIRVRHSPTAPFNDDSLITTVECTLCEDQQALLSNPMHHTPPLYLQPLPSIPAVPPIREQPIMVYQQPPFKHFEGEPIHIPELRAPAFAPVQTPVQMNPELNFPMPTFASPAFQATLQSSHSRAPTPSPNQVFSANYYPPMYASVPVPIMRTPTEYVYMTPFQMQPQIENGGRPPQPKASDFTIFTNKFVQ